MRRFYAVKLFEHDDKIKTMMSHAPDVDALVRRWKASWTTTRKSIITNQRYEWISSLIRQCKDEEKSGGALGFR